MNRLPLLLAAVTLMLGACSSSEASPSGDGSPESGPAVETADVTLDDISMSVHPDTLSAYGLTLILTGAPGTEYGIGEEFTLEQWTGSEWAPLPHLSEYAVTWDEGLSIFNFDDMTALQVGVDWTWSYGRLEKGTYRIIQPVFTAAQPEREHSLAAEFTLDNLNAEDQPKSIPSLALTYEEDGSVKTLSISTGIGAWTYEGEDGEGVMTIGDGPHPLSNVDGWKRLTKTDMMTEVALSFSTPPESYSVLAWRHENTDEPAANTAVHVPVTDDRIALIDDGANYVYEIRAQWSQGNGNFYIYIESE